MKKKLRARTGETLSEVLIAMLIVVMAFLFLCGAVVSAARINSRLKNEDVVFQTEGREDKTAEKGFSVSINGTGIGSVKLYQTKNGYYYYE